MNLASQQQDVTRSRGRCRSGSSGVHVARGAGADLAGRQYPKAPHTAIRKRVAEHMARSLIDAPHVTTLFEADLTRVLVHRARCAADDESRGARLTLTAYFISVRRRRLCVPTGKSTRHFTRMRWRCTPTSTSALARLSAIKD